MIKGTMEMKMITGLLSAISAAIALFLEDLTAGVINSMLKNLTKHLQIRS